MALSARTLEHTLKVTTEADDAELEELDEGVSGLSVSFAGAATAAVAAVGAIVGAIAGASAAVITLTNDMVDHVDTINTMAKSTGLANSTMAALQEAANSTGKSLTDLVPTDLSKRIAETAQGTGRARRGFEMLGLEAAIVSGELQTSDEVLRATLDALAGIEDPTKKSTAALLALGPAGQQMLTAFEDSGGLDAYVALVEEFGTDVSDDAVAAAGEWQAALAQLGMATAFARDTLIRMLGGPETFAVIVNNIAAGMMAATVVVEQVVTAWATRFMALGEVIRDVLGIDAMRKLLTGDISGAVREYGRGLSDAFESLAGGEVFSLDWLTVEVAGALEAGVETFANAKAYRADAGAGRGALPGSGAGPEEVPPSAGDGTVTLVARTVEYEGDFASASGSAAIQGPELAVAEGSPRGLAQAADDIGSAVGSVMASTVMPALGVLEGIVALPDMIDGVAGTLEAVPDALLAIPDALSNLLRGLPSIVGGIIEALPEALFDLARVLITELPVAIGQALWEAIKGLVPKFLRGDGASVDDARARVDEISSDMTPAQKAAYDQAINEAVPMFDTGGYVASTGLAIVHKGEFVQTADAVRAGAAGGGGSVTIGQITVVSNDPADMVRQIREHIGRYGAGSLLSPSAFG